MSDRLTELEIKLAFLERHVAAQDKEMLGLHEEIERLRKAVAGLRARVSSGTTEDEPPPSSSERPPHY